MHYLKIISLILAIAGVVCNLIALYSLLGDYIYDFVSDIKFKIEERRKKKRL